MSTASRTDTTRATLADLHDAPGKAELIGGRIVHFMANGYRPSLVAANVYRSLDESTRAVGRGVGFTDNMGFAVPELSTGRESFSPDASYYVGPLPADEMDFVAGPPTFAVEVRSKSDFGDAAESEMSAKRADYFEAGTLVVWDVDLRDGVVRSYRADAPDRPVVFGPGEEADAEPAVPGWRIAVDRIFA